MGNPVITITYGGVEQSAAAWGLTARPKITTRDRSPTVFSFRMAGADPAGGVPFNYYPALLAAGSTVAAAETACRVVIKQGRVFNAATGAWSGSGWIFTGYLATKPGDVSGNRRGINLVFKDAIWLMQNTTFQQLWAVAQFADDPIWASRCVLFMDINLWVPNTYMSVQWQVQQIIAYAQLCGIGIAAGAIDYSGWYLNYYHCRAISIWDALLKCLEPIPDAKVWVDGSQPTPLLHIRTRANIAAMASPAGTGPGPITMPYEGVDAFGREHKSSKDFDARWDIVPNQVVLQYQINNTYNGKSSPTWINDVWPPVVGGTADGQRPFALVCPIDLTGTSVTSETGTLDCEPVMAMAAQTGYEAGSADDHAAKRAWWGSKRGGETDKLTNVIGGYVTADWRVRFGAATLADATITDDYGNAINLAAYPNRIVKGTYHAWMTLPNTKTPVVAIRAHIKVAAQFAEYDVPGSTPAETDTNGHKTRGANTHELHCHVTLTNAAAGVTPFSRQQVTAYSETPVPNLAENIFTSRQIVDYDGHHEIVDPGIKNGKTPTQPLQQIIGHWNVLNFSGGEADWATANMTIASTEIDLVTNHVSIEAGPSKHLNPQDWSSMLQFFRGRLVVSAASIRATGQGDPSDTVDMALNTPDANTVPGQAVDAQQQLLTYANPVDPTSAVNGASNLDTNLVPALVAGATPVGTAAGMVTLQPRPVAVCDNSGDNFLALFHVTEGHNPPA